MRAVDQRPRSLAKIWVHHESRGELRPSGPHQIDLDEAQTFAREDAAAWQGLWQKVLEETAGVAPYLASGTDYVEDLRRTDVESLSISR